MPSGFALPDKPDSGTQPQSIEHVTLNVNGIGLMPTAQMAACFQRVEIISKRFWRGGRGWSFYEVPAPVSIQQPAEPGLPCGPAPATRNRF